MSSFLILLKGNGGLKRYFLVICSTLLVLTESEGLANLRSEGIDILSIPHCYGAWQTLRLLVQCFKYPKMLHIYQPFCVLKALQTKFLIRIVQSACTVNCVNNTTTTPHCTLCCSYCQALLLTLPLRLLLLLLLLLQWLQPKPRGPSSSVNIIIIIII